ncbi:MAG: UDP-N-acetylmuramate dehydrogenase [Alphaproteobacteria bacterium]|nr:UDP-N-acetylmuramate dehydrogenase [Alphaproteobacteria bacterium]
MTAADKIEENLQGLRDDFSHEGLTARLPATRGKMIPNALLADQTWFRVGGPAEVLYKPSDENDLAHFLAHCPQDIPITIMGLASNTLVRDGGVPGVVIKLSPDFAHIKFEDGALKAGAAAVNLNVARSAQSAGLAGLEFLSGIPGTIGGGLRMNAGAYGSEMKDVVRNVTALDRAGHKHILRAGQMGFAYRHCGIPSDWVFLTAEFEGEPDDPAAILKRMQDIQKKRAETQPTHEKTGGSTFANPDNDPEGRKAWQLIQEAGCRGLKVGKAKVSDKHCNFLINTGLATAADIEKLGEEVRRRVKEKTGIELRWEIQRIGVGKDKTE